MKQLFFIISFFFATTLYAQEIQIQASKQQQKFVAEHIETIDKHTLYGYGEIAINNAESAYMQTFYEYNMGLVSLHGEYRSFLYQGYSWQNSFFAGISLSLVSNNRCYFNIAPLYRYENKSMWQATATYGCNYKRITFDGYFDFYGDKNINAFSENKIKLSIGRFFVGTNIEFILSNSYSKVNPYFMIGIKL